jgi:hypothetical protein
LCDARDWEGLDVLAGERKVHPVGWEAFIETAKKYGATRDVVARLIARTPDSPAKVGSRAGAGMRIEHMQVFPS